MPCADVSAGAMRRTTVRLREVSNGFKESEVSTENISQQDERLVS